MDPTHFIAATSIARKDDCKAGRAEIDAFYDQHSCDLCVTFSRLSLRIHRVFAEMHRVGHRKPSFADRAQTR